MVLTSCLSGILFFARSLALSCSISHFGFYLGLVGWCLCTLACARERKISLSSFFVLSFFAVDNCYCERVSDDRIEREFFALSRASRDPFCIWHSCRFFFSRRCIGVSVFVWLFISYWLVGKFISL